MPSMVVCGLLAAAYILKPTPASFLDWIPTYLRRVQPSSSPLDAARITMALGVVTVQMEVRENPLFVVVRAPVAQKKQTFIGAFGRWFHVPFLDN